MEAIHARLAEVSALRSLELAEASTRLERWPPAPWISFYGQRAAARAVAEQAAERSAELGDRPARRRAIVERLAHH